MIHFEINFYTCWRGQAPLAFSHMCTSTCPTTISSKHYSFPIALSCYSVANQSAVTVRLSTHLRTRPWDAHCKHSVNGLSFWTDGGFHSMIIRHGLVCSFVETLNSVFCAPSLDFEFHQRGVLQRGVYEVQTWFPAFWELTWRTQHQCPIIPYEADTWTLFPEWHSSPHLSLGLSVYM